MTSAAVASASSPLVTAEEWFSSGKRVHFDYNRKEICPEKRKDSVSVFYRVVVPHYSNPDAQWLTMLPGFPVGSYGYSKIESLLQINKNLNADIPRLYVEYVGQGNSEKPREGYTYSTVERANLVEAHWKAQGVKSTVLVTLDFSSLVMMELLCRQKQREAKGIRFPRIEHVISINGGYFADGHATGALNTPLVRSCFGPMISSAAQRSSMVFNKMLTPLYSREYRKSDPKHVKQELKEMQKSIRLHNGSRAMNSISYFVDEHKQKAGAEKWNLLSIYQDYCLDQDITFHLVASQQDPFEGDQLMLVQYRMKAYEGKVSTEIIPGGNQAATEQAELLVDRIYKMIQRCKAPHKNKSAQAKSWTSLESPASSSSTLSWTTSSTKSVDVDYGLAF